MKQEDDDAQVYRSEMEAAIKAAVNAEREEIIALLDGIDQTETDSPCGWWETSAGAAFGARILDLIRARGQE